MNCWSRWQVSSLRFRVQGPVVYRWPTPGWSMGWESHPQSRRRWIYSPLSSLHCSTHGIFGGPDRLCSGVFGLQSRRLPVGPRARNFWWSLRDARPRFVLAKDASYCWTKAPVEMRGFAPPTRPCRGRVILLSPHPQFPSLYLYRLGSVESPRWNPTVLLSAPNGSKG